MHTTDDNLPVILELLKDNWPMFRSMFIDEHKYKLSWITPLECVAPMYPVTSINQITHSLALNNLDLVKNPKPEQQANLLITEIENLMQSHLTALMKATSTEKVKHRIPTDGSFLLIGPVIVENYPIYVSFIRSYVYEFASQ